MVKIFSWMRNRLGALSPPPPKSAAEAESPFAEERALIAASGLFDDEWYRAAYPDVAAAGFDPPLHYLLHGAAENRDPGPEFSTSGYRLACPDLRESGQNPLVHYLSGGRQQGLHPRPLLPGARPRRAGARTVLVCGHLAGAQVYGAERGLLDVLSSLGRLGFDVLTTLPAAGCPDYLAAVREASVGVRIIPYQWWRKGRPVGETSVRLFTEVIREFGVDVVLLNTIVLLEPAVAARRCRVPVVVHAREIPERDPDLCAVLGAAAAEIRAHVLSLTDRIIVNSRAVEKFFAAPEKTALVPDCIDLAAFDKVQEVDFDRPRVGMISSNLPKKGLTDFVEMARLLVVSLPRLQCLLIGPENEHVQDLREAAAEGKLPGNIVLAGYARSPQEAIQSVEVVVNLSRVEESFGRTILEAMAARRPVVCYDWGALGELVVDGETGFLVPFGDVAAVAERVRMLFEAPARRRRFGEAGRMRAEKYFGMAEFDRKLKSAFDHVLS